MGGQGKAILRRIASEKVQGRRVQKQQAGGPGSEEEGWLEAQAHTVMRCSSVKERGRVHLGGGTAAPGGSGPMPGQMPGQEMMRASTETRGLQHLQQHQGSSKTHKSTARRKKGAVIVAGGAVTNPNASTNAIAQVDGGPSSGEMARTNATGGQSPARVPKGGRGTVAAGRHSRSESALSQKLNQEGSQQVPAGHNRSSSHTSAHVAGPNGVSSLGPGGGAVGGGGGWREGEGGMNLLGRPCVDVSERYVMSGDVLGRGYFGEVLVCQARSNGAFLACKLIRKENVKVRGMRHGMVV